MPKITDSLRSAFNIGSSTQGAASTARAITKTIIGSPPTSPVHPAADSTFTARKSDSSATSVAATPELAAPKLLATVGAPQAAKKKFAAAHQAEGSALRDEALRLDKEPFGGIISKMATVASPEYGPVPAVFAGLLQSVRQAAAGLQTRSAFAAPTAGNQSAASEAVLRARAYLNRIDPNFINAANPSFDARAVPADGPVLTHLMRDWLRSLRQPLLKGTTTATHTVLQDETIPSASRTLANLSTNLELDATTADANLRQAIKTAAIAQGAAGQLAAAVALEEAQLAPIQKNTFRALMDLCADMVTAQHGQPDGVTSQQFGNALAPLLVKVVENGQWRQDDVQPTEGHPNAALPTFIAHYIDYRVQLAAGVVLVDATSKNDVDPFVLNFPGRAAAHAATCVMNQVLPHFQTLNGGKMTWAQGASVLFLTPDGVLATQKNFAVRISDVGLNPQYGEQYRSLLTTIDPSGTSLVVLSASQLSRHDAATIVATGALMLGSGARLSRVQHDALEELTELDLTAQGPLTNDTLWELSEMCPRLTSLAVQTEETALLSLRAFPALTHLRVEGKNLRNLGWLASHATLQSLTIDGGDYKRKASGRALSDLPQLRNLSLANMTGFTLSHIANAANLRRLVLDNMGVVRWLPDRPVNQLQFLSHLNQLQSVTIRNDDTLLDLSVFEGRRSPFFDAGSAAKLPVRPRLEVANAARLHNITGLVSTGLEFTYSNCPGLDVTALTALADASSDKQTYTVTRYDPE